MPKTHLWTTVAVQPEFRFSGDFAASDEIFGCLARVQSVVSVGRSRPGGAPVFSLRSGLDLSCRGRVLLDADHTRADRYRPAAASGQDYIADPVGRACGQPAGKHVHYPGIRRYWSHDGLPLALAGLPDLPPSDRQGRDGIRRLQDACCSRRLARMGNAASSSFLLFVWLHFDCDHAQAGQWIQLAQAYTVRPIFSVGRMDRAPQR